MYRKKQRFKIKKVRDKSKKTQEIIKIHDFNCILFYELIHTFTIIKSN